jgi:hypothetical protein
MAFKKPVINTIKPDIKNVSIYLRSVKKFGKSTLFRDVILEKYGDPARGLLVEIGMERGDTLLDNVNTTHIDTYKDLIELQKWLIECKGTEHNIEIVGFDVADEIVPLFDKETIRQHNIENPQKPIKSIKAAMGGYTAGEQYSATLMKNYFDKIKSAGMQVWVLGHSKYKNIKDKANIDNEGYMQLSSNLSAAYEAALGDIFDVVLTGIIDRNIETVGDGDNAKRYATDAIRKLYFRGTPEIDAGGRFAAGSVPEYLVFDKPNMAADFIRIIEEGMERSKTTFAPTPETKKPTTKKSTKKAPVDEDDELMEKLRAAVEQAEEYTKVVDDEAPFDVGSEIDDIFAEETVEDEMITLDDARMGAIRDSYKAADAKKKSEVKKYLVNYNGRLCDTMKQSDVDAIESVLGLSDEV